MQKKVGGAGRFKIGALCAVRPNFAPPENGVHPRYLAASPTGRLEVGHFRPSATKAACAACPSTLVGSPQGDLAAQSNQSSSSPLPPVSERGRNKRWGIAPEEPEFTRLVLAKKLGHTPENGVC